MSRLTIIFLYLCFCGVLNARKGLMSGPPDNWKLPNLTAIRLQYEGRWPMPLDKMMDFNGNPISYADFPPLRLNPIGERSYLVYVFVNQFALEATFNLIASLRRFSIQHVLLLCENEQTAKVLNRTGLYHYYPRDLTRTLNERLGATYWGPSIWMRCNFNYHMIQHGVNLAFLDADVVIVQDPRPVFFAPKVDMSTAMRVSGNDPWLWTFPFLERCTSAGAGSRRSVRETHFVELNNGLSRYDSSLKMMVFFEAMKMRMLKEMELLKMFKGWDLSARGRTLYEGNLTFCRFNVTRHGNEKVLVSGPNDFGLSVTLFQTLGEPGSKALSLGIPGQAVGHFSFHAHGHVRKGQVWAWFTKLNVLRTVCWVLHKEAMDLFRSWNYSRGEANFWAMADAGQECCLNKCGNASKPEDYWAHTLLLDFASVNRFPPNFQEYMQLRGNASYKLLNRTSSKPAADGPK